MSRLRIIKHIGLFMFLAAFAMFLALPFTSKFSLSNDLISEVILDTGHRTDLQPGLTKLAVKTYSSRLTFLKDYNTVLNQVNNRYKNAEQWDKVIYNDYAFALVRASTKGIIATHTNLLFLLIIIGGCIGALMYSLPNALADPPGIKNNNIFHAALTATGWSGILLGSFLIGFYIALYWYGEYITDWVRLADPISLPLTGKPAGKWFLYGLLYTLAVLVMGARMLLKYRHSKYQMIRTVSVMFFQTAFAFIIPEILVRLNLPYMDLKNMWPLDYTFFFDYQLDELIQAGTIGWWMLGWGIALFVIGVPVFVFFFGKRWYCSWVCGCGGLAETLGDPFRQLSDKSMKAWKIERWLVHSVLIFAVVMTGAVLYSYFTGEAKIVGIETYSIRATYGFMIGSVFAGVIGTGFYPLMGNRMWCRFGCPLAAYLGFVQRFKSRFRITTNGGQCISCGNCSTYCEMGIDVKWYAQRGQNIVRSSCVGCGICSAVCPRGVLNLENTSGERMPGPIKMTEQGIQLERLNDE